MRTTIPKNNVSFDYEKVINEFVFFLKEKQVKLRTNKT